jgi:hypothetical protein
MTFYSIALNCSHLPDGPQKEQITKDGPRHENFIKKSKIAVTAANIFLRQGRKALARSHKRSVLGRKGRSEAALSFYASILRLTVLNNKKIYGVLTRRNPM